MTVTMTMEEYEALTANLARALDMRNRLRNALGEIDQALLGEPRSAAKRVRAIVDELKGTK